MKKYKVILADPPWLYNDKGSSKHPGASHKYNCMKLEDLMNLPIDIISDTDSVLFLWSTMPMLPNALKLVEAWGFKYKTIGFVWVKRNKKKKDGWFYGMGHWTRSNPEVVILGVRGNPKRASANVHSIIESPIKIHSSKPDELYDRIEELCGDVPRVELFARKTRDGWDSIGYEIDGKDIRDVLKVGE